MSVQSAIPVLPSLDIQKSCDFLVEKLGFAHNFVWANDDGQKPNYGGVVKDGVHVHFITVDDVKVCEWTVMRIYVDDIETHYKHAEGQGIVHPNGALSEKPWGEKEFCVLDAHGVALFFAQELES